MRYAVFFRGINVGGKNKAAMSDVRQLLLELGLSDVKTYIQSGNAVFRSNLDEASLCQQIQTGFAKRFGFESTVVLRNMEEMRLLIEQLPLTKTQIQEAEAADPQVQHLYLFLMEHPVVPQRLEDVMKEYTGSDILLSGKRELYFLCQESVRNSKLAILIGKTFPSATSRNWKTICRIYDMLTAL